MTVVFSKADQSGWGRILHHHAAAEGEGHCVVGRLEEYIRMSHADFGAREEDLLFHVTGLACLTTDMLSSVMRGTCRALGLPDTRVSAHSLRYDGATTLAAAGFPEYVIAFYRGGAPGSKAMHRYIQPSDEAVRAVSSHMSRNKNADSVHSGVRRLLAHRVPPSLYKMDNVALRPKRN